MAGPRAPTEVPGGALKTRGQQAWHRPCLGAATRTPPVSPVAAGCSPSWALGEGDSLSPTGRWRVFQEDGPTGGSATARGGAALAREHTRGQKQGNCCRQNPGRATAALCAGGSLLTGAARRLPGATPSVRAAWPPPTTSTVLKTWQ